MSGTGYGEIWFAQPNADSLARVNPDGSITERPVAEGSRPLAIARGKLGGRIVFTLVGTNRIGLMDANGDVTEFDIPTPASHPRGIAIGQSIWFTEYDGNRVGRLDIGSATPIVEFTIPTFNSGPLGIAPGPGATSGTTDIWFTEFLANKIGRIDANGVITEYDIPTPDSGPTAIVQGTVANQAVMYFTESKANKIGRITATGRITEYAIPTPNSGPADIVADSFEGVWFSERLAGKLAWLSEDGELREFSLPASSRPEGISVDYEGGFFEPWRVWYVDGTKRKVGRLSDNHLFALGAGHGPGWDTEFELTSVDGRTTLVELGYPFLGVCVPGACPATTVVFEVPRNATVSKLASDVPSSEGDHPFLLTAIHPQINDVPETRAWIVDTDTDLRVELPLIDYWTVVSLQPPLARGSSGPQPVLRFPARRRAGVRTELVLAALAGPDNQNLDVLLEAVTPQGEVVGEMPLELPLGELVVLDRVLSDLNVFGDFEGYLEVKRVSRSGLMWGVAKIFENDHLARLMPPGSELDQECVGGPARCGPPRNTRVVTRQAGAPVLIDRAHEREQEELKP